ncbi:MAG: hypothetical protein BJ554DRAFT_243 [Olpidium bornovanus]|uniref:Pyruvate kinase C-terminal domain-containing protein n=1 Tax=Olpidium bornovanus TaxID=278681 RepID=A0A8H8A1N1_9FUNG|nr:MAG: hypothetical protein BJ554DRAFT_243 [Olpidium bornovanus]
MPVLTATRNAATARQCHLYRGCYPFLYPKPPVDECDPAANADADQAKHWYSWQHDVDDRIQWCMEEAKRAGILQSGAAVICIQGWRSGKAVRNYAPALALTPRGDPC